MTKAEIRNLRDEVITYDVLEEIELCDFVTDVVNCGNSGQHVGGTLLEVIFGEYEEAICLVVK